MDFFYQTLSLNRETFITLHLFYICLKIVKYIFIYFSLILYLGDKLLNEHFGVSSRKRKSNLVKDTSFDDDSEIAEPLSI